MKPKLLTTYLLSLFDLLCTLLLVQQYGTGIEANPIGRALLSNPWGIAYKVIGVGVLLWVLYMARGKPLARAGSYLVLSVYAVLAVYHAVIIVIIVII